ncbi:hypothetical protein TWF694_005567 [Orbilia ellipsospora]|uniref:Uncharacterized protein n=1 Tax=Orbilia ellipsospora TaxID=2528407 RepID=A0AAV9WUJ6_9PEZI
MELLVQGFEDNGDDDFGPTIPSLETWTASASAFSIPWSHEVKAIMTGFKSALMKKDSGPWLVSCPFDATSIKLTTVIPDSGGGVTSYRDGMSSHTGSSSEHLSAELAVTVGYPFLNASVSGKYDRSIKKNDHSLKVSRNSSCRMGRVILADTPHFSTEALNILRFKGREKFTDVYGDYYLVGYELGADAGACLSAASSSSSKEETLKLTVTVKVLWVRKSITHTETSSSSSSSTSFRFSGYSTLDYKTELLDLKQVSSQDQEKLHEVAQLYLSKISSLGSDIRACMEELELVDGKQLPLKCCSAVCESGLVVALLLEPFERLSQYQQSVKRR